MRTGVPVSMVAEPRRDAGRRDGDRRSVRAELQDVVDRLIEDYRDDVPAGSVIRCVARCTEIATRYGVPKPALASVVERLARATLDARSRSGLPTHPHGEAWLPTQLRLDPPPIHQLETTDEPCTSG